jgi:hypothetical protein
MLSVMQKTQRMGWSSIGRVGRSIGRHGGNDPDVYGSTMCLSCKGASLQPLYLSSSISISTLLSLSGWYFSAFFYASFDGSISSLRTCPRSTWTKRLRGPCILQGEHQRQGVCA